MVRVVVAGHVNWDVTIRVEELPEPDGEAIIESQRRSGGGSAANVSAALAGFGVETGLIGSVGDDEHGLLARRELQEIGVDLENLLVVEGAETSVKYLIVSSDGEVMVLGNDGANEAVDPGNVNSEYVENAEFLHLTSQRSETAAWLSEVANDAGVTVSFDPGRRLDERDFSEALDRSDIVFANDREAPSLFSDENVRESPYGDRVVVVKHGAAGATVYTPDGTYQHPGFGIDPVDTTGAGDAFAGGFIATLLDDWDYERAVEYANACGALASLSEGARTAPVDADVDEFLEERYAD